VDFVPRSTINKAANLKEEPEKRKLKCSFKKLVKLLKGNGVDPNDADNESDEEEVNEKSPLNKKESCKSILRG
jgi:hypothetical protein